INGIIGALAISSFPFTSGFVTKSLETSAAAYQGLTLVWFLLLAASAGVFLHAGIKFPWFVFFQRDSGLRPPDPAPTMRWAMWLFSFLCLAIGLYPQALYSILPYPVDYQPYTWEHLVTQFQLLLFAGFAFFALLPLMKRTLTLSLDVDWFYRRLMVLVVGKSAAVIARGDGAVRAAASRGVTRVLAYISRHHGPDGMLARTWPTGSVVTWVVVLLAVYLVFSLY